MMRQYELVERVQKYDPGADEDLLNRAYVYAMRAHGSQTRASGDPYFSHPLEVAAILTELRLDDATIATALLHDVVEDTDTTRDEIADLFGDEIADLVDGLTKLKKLDLVTKQAEQAENFRKLLIAISSDIRVLLVKLADRLHNMRTLGSMPEDKRRRISEETLEIYTPLAGRMGMQWLREELEDLCFRWVYPQAHDMVAERLAALRTSNAGLIDEIGVALRAEIAAAGINAEVVGREKKPFSIWKKMERKQISLEQLSDIYAFRIIVDNVPDCYAVLGRVHTNWHAVPGRMKDFISNPKPNEYQSLHTTIVGPQTQRVELQIRTREMHDIAEYGVAAHAAYKDSPASIGVTGRVRQWDSGSYQWLRRLVETLLEGDNPEDFLEHTKLELFQDQVFCFTPRGRLIALPQGATPIDFAYAVHTDVGNACVGAKVNGRNMPLMTELQNGDEIEILTSEAQTPPSAWEKIAKTGKARSAIKRASREAQNRQFAELGRQILLGAFKKVGETFSKDILRRGLPRLSQRSVDDVILAVARGELPSSHVIQAVFPEHEVPEPDAKPRRQRNRHEPVVEEGWFNLRRVIGLKFRMPGTGQSKRPSLDDALPVRGYRGDLPVEFEESGAVPGDRIVGILTPEKGIRIYPIDSPKLKAFDDEPERWIDVTWDTDHADPERFEARIHVVTMNEPGSLGQLAQVIGEADGNIDNLRMHRVAADYTELVIDLEVWDLKHLNQIMSGIDALPVVNRVERRFDAGEPAHRDQGASP
ncbi:MAG: RelA/SpoT family protein [Hyphomicrobiaceae bacterium]